MVFTFAYPGAVLELAFPVQILMKAFWSTLRVHGKVRTIPLDLAVLGEVNEEPRAFRQVFWGFT